MSRMYVMCVTLVFIFGLSRFFAESIAALGKLHLFLFQKDELLHSLGTTYRKVYMDHHTLKI